jgi:hypothetical protein
VDHEPSIPTQAGRTGRTSLSALLVVGLLIGVTVSAIKPGVRAFHRDASAELQATRQIAQTLVRAVRGLARQDIHKPSTLQPVSQSALATRHAYPAMPSESEVTGSPLLRESLLALPPPVA